MTYEDLYTATLNKLKLGERPLIRLTPELIIELREAWNKAIDSEKIDHNALKKILCILDNTQNMTSELNAQFLKTLNKVRDQEILIYTLAASQKHIVMESLRTGTMISEDYFTKLKELLNNKNPEIVEWTLRTIETMGPLSLRLMSDVKKLNLGFFTFLNKHSKNSEQLISLMKLQWDKMRL
jgi:hypothetical protein